MLQGSLDRIAWSSREECGLMEAYRHKQRPQKIGGSTVSPILENYYDKLPALPPENFHPQAKKHVPVEDKKKASTLKYLQSLGIDITKINL